MCDRGSFFRTPLVSFFHCMYSEASQQREKAAEWVKQHGGKPIPREYKLVGAATARPFVGGVRRPASSEAEEGLPFKMQKGCALGSAADPCSFVHDRWLQEMETLPFEELCRAVEEHQEEGKRDGLAHYSHWEMDMRDAGLDPEEHREEWYRFRPAVILQLRREAQLLEHRSRVNEQEKWVEEGQQKQREWEERRKKRADKVEMKKRLEDEAEAIFHEEALSSMRAALTSIDTASASSDEPCPPVSRFASCMSSLCLPFCRALSDEWMDVGGAGRQVSWPRAPRRGQAPLQAWSQGGPGRQGTGGLRVGPLSREAAAQAPSLGGLGRQVAAREAGWTRTPLGHQRCGLFGSVHGRRCS